MKMTCLFCAGWYALGDNRHIGAFYEMPAITNISPDIVFGG